MESTSRPLSGIAALWLGAASLSQAASTLKESGTVIPLLEDQSSYSESVEYLPNGRKCVKHRLEAITAIDFELPDELYTGLIEGFVALILLRSFNQIEVGWSSTAQWDRPLRLVSLATQSGDESTSKGYKKWIFESTDESCAI